MILNYLKSKLENKPSLLKNDAPKRHLNGNLSAKHGLSPYELLVSKAIKLPQEDTLLSLLLVVYHI